MAKRDKLYTVNKWNKSIFEEEQRRKRLYDNGGIIPGLRLNQAWKTFGLGEAPGSNFNYIQNRPFYTTQDNYIGRDAYINPYQEMVKTYASEPTDNGGGSTTNHPTSALVKASDNPTISKVASNISDLANAISKTDWFKNLGKSAAESTTGSFASRLTTPLAKDLTAESLLKQGYVKDMAKDMSANAASTAAKSGISSLGKAGINLGAAIGSELGYNWISDGLSTGAGLAIKSIGSAAGTVLQFIPGVGWAAAPIVTLASGILGGIANQWGHKTFDNGATAYTNRLNAMNPNGSNEYLANLLANTGIGPRATYKDGWFTDKGKREARNINNMQDLALTRFQRGIRDAFKNNNTFQLWNAINDYSVSAMGGKLNRCKCNKKAYGGYLDSATPTGFNFLSDFANAQLMKSQNNQDATTSLGNSFMGIDSPITLAEGGRIHINPDHKGRLTKLKKRTGKTEAELYNDGNPAHKKMVVFARNARRWNKHALGGKLNNGKDQDTWNDSFFNGTSIYDLGGVLQAGGSNWGNVSEINEGGTHEQNPNQGVQVGTDPEGTPNLVEEGEVIWNDYVFSNRIKCPKEVCKELRVGQKKDGFTFAEVAKKLLRESKERPNDPISKRGLEANMQKLEDYQEEVKSKMDAERAVEEFNNLPPEQQVAIMNQEGEKAQQAVLDEAMALEFNNLPPEQQQAIAQQMAMEQAAAQGQGIPQGQPSPEEQAMMQQQYAQLSGINPQEVINQTIAMQQAGLNQSALGGALYKDGGKKYIKGAKSHWEENARGEKVLVPNTPFENTGFGGGEFGSAGGGGEWGDEPSPLAPRKRDWLAIDYQQSFNDAYNEARKNKQKTFWFNGKEYSTDYNPNLTEEQVKQGMNRYQTKGLIITPWEHGCGGRLHAEGGELGSGETQAADNEMAKYSDEELQDMIDDYQEAANGETKVTKGRLERLKRKAEKAEEELKRRYSKEENKSEVEGEASEAPAEAMPAQQQEQQMMEEQSQQVNPEAMAMQQQMAQQMSSEQMAAAELLQQEGLQYAYGGHLYDDGGQLGKYGQYFKDMSVEELLGKIYDSMGSDKKKEITRSKFIEKMLNELNNKSDHTAVLSPYEAHMEHVYRSMNPEAKNSFITFNSNPYRTWGQLNLNGIKANKSKSGKGNAKLDESLYVNDPVYRQLTDTEKAYKGNDLARAFENNQTYQEFTEDLKKEWDKEWAMNHIGILANAGSVIANNIIEPDGNGGWKYKVGKEDVLAAIENGRNDASKIPTNETNKNGNTLGLWHYTPEKAENWQDRYWIKNTDGTYDLRSGKPSDEEFVLMNPNSPYKVTKGTNNFNDYYYQAKSEAEKAANGNRDTEYMTVGWEPKTNWTDYTLGMLPGLTGLAFQIGMGKPNTSGLDAAEAYAERYSGIMAPPHLTHGYIKPAIIDPRVRENTMNARRLGTNRILLNTGPSPSLAANILISDANYQQQLGLQHMQDWLANRQLEQQAAAFNRETNTTNANILNATDQFNAQMQANAARSIADMKYKVALDKINQDNAYKAGIIGNVGSIFQGLNEARKQQNINNQRDILLASGVFGETNPFLENYYGISKVDPATGKVVRGYKTGWYYRTNPKTGKPEYSENPFQPSLAINACGGKIKKNKKKRGYTF